MKLSRVSFLVLGLGFFPQAASSFQLTDLYSNQWRLANNAYRTGNYAQAESMYKSINNVDSDYNQANALAYLGQYDTAIAVYDRVLQKNPQHKDAQFNRKIVISLLGKTKKPASKKNDRNKRTSKQQEQLRSNTQWLNLVPDDTGSFLQEKFLRDYSSRR